MNGTGKELARIIGVSPSTISMVINNKPGISDEKRAEILSKIRELKFDSLLKNEQSERETENVAFVVFRCENAILGETPFITLLAEPISLQLNSYNYNMIFVEMNSGNFARKMNDIMSMSCVGIILDAVEMGSEELALFENCPVPFVIFNNNFLSKDFDTVCVHNYQGVCKALEHLVSLGHKHIGFIKSKSKINSFEERLDAIKFFKSKFDIKFEESDIFTLPYSQVGAYEEMKHILDMVKEKGMVLPTAFISDNDVICYPAMCAFQEKGYRIPDDISMIGFDDRPLCENSTPKLTTLRIHRRVFGESAVDLLKERINNPHRSHVTTQIGVSLIVRESTGKAKSK